MKQNLTFGPHPTHPQLSNCEGLVKFIDDNAILNNKYVKIFVNPFENHLPKLFMNEIRRFLFLSSNLGAKVLKNLMKFTARLTVTILETDPKQREKLQMD